MLDLGYHERRFEIRAEPDSNALSGTAIRYGDVASLPWGRERFEAGAFADLASMDVILNMQHMRHRMLARTGGSGLEFSDSQEALSFRAEMPDTRDAQDALTLVRTGVLRGASIEFRATTERLEAGVIVISRAVLVGLSLVDRPAYPASTIEAARARQASRPLPRANGIFRYVGAI